MYPPVDPETLLLAQPEISGDDLRTQPQSSEELIAFIIGAASLGFIPPVNQQSAPFYRQMRMGPVFPQSGPAFQPPFRNNPGVGMLRMDIPHIQNWERDKIAALPDNKRREIVIFCHELLHYLHFLDNRALYTKMKAPIVGDKNTFSSLEEQYTVAGAQTLSKGLPQEVRKGKLGLQLSQYFEHSICDVLGLPRRISDKVGLIDQQPPPLPDQPPPPPPPGDQQPPAPSLPHPPHSPAPEPPDVGENKSAALEKERQDALSATAAAPQTLSGFIGPSHFFYASY